MVELEPPQPVTVADAVAELLGSGELRPDPWWQAGLDEALAIEDGERTIVVG